MVNEQEKSNLTPILIIGGIFLATIFGIYMISQSGAGDEVVDGDNTTASPNANQETPSNSTEQPTDGKLPGYDKPTGATPPNFKGSADSPVVIEEFADFQCPTCGVVHPKIKEITSKYGDKIKVIFRNYPLVQAHPNAYAAAVAAEAAGQQNKFWEMQDLIFVNQGNWSNMGDPRPEFEKYAQQIGLNIEKFKDDSLAMNVKSRVDADLNRGRELNITSTPSVLINGRLIPHTQVDVTQLSQLIDAELAKVGSQPKTEEKTSDKDDKDTKTEEKPNK